MSALEADPSSPGDVYAARSDGVFATTDGGGTWHPFDNGLPSLPITALVLHAEDPVRLYAGTGGGGVFWFFSWCGGIDDDCCDDDGDSCWSGGFFCFHGHCFIATAAYGSWLHPHVKSLRRFRDEYLLTNAPGRALVRLYQRASPSLAYYIRKHPSARFAARCLLAPLVLAVEHPLPAALLLVILPAAALLLLLLRSRRRHRLRGHTEIREEGQAIP